MQIAIDVLLWFLVILVSVVLALLAEGPIHWLLARTIGGLIPRRPRSVTGLWQTEYAYERGGKKMVEEQIIELRQFGAHVVGKSIKAQAHPSEFMGRFQHQIYFTGSWRRMGRGQINHGAFQLILHAEGQRMDGEWVGFSEKLHVVKHGSWKWVLVSQSVSRDAKRKVLGQEA
jgi:hypothetical protein